MLPNRSQNLFGEDVEMATDNQQQHEQESIMRDHHTSENTIINRLQSPLTNNNKKSFCIEALLAKNHNSSEDAAQQSQQQTLQEKMSHQKYLAIIQHHQQLSGVSHHFQNHPPPDFLQMKSNLEIQSNPLLESLKSSSPFKTGCDVDIERNEYEHENYERQIASNTIERYERDPSPNSGPRSPSSNRSPSPEEASEDHRSNGSYSPPISPGMEIERQEYADHRTGCYFIVKFMFECLRVIWESFLKLSRIVFN